MARELTFYYTSDNHGYFSPLDYATGAPMNTGLANCMSNFSHDGNSIVLDGGDSLQGNPFIYYLHRSGKIRENLPAKLLNCAGVQYFTIGNHDFNYGKELLESYIRECKGVCLCANVDGVEGVEKTAVFTAANGLRVGLTGIVTHFVNVWEKPKNLEGICITPPIPAAEQALRELRAQGTDINVCIYHGGFECDLDSGKLLSDTEENQGWRICHELDFDVLFTGHQHMAIENRRIGNTLVCQTPDKAREYIRMDLAVEEKTGEEKNAVASGRLQGSSHLLPAGDVTDPTAAELLAKADEEAARWLDTPVGHLDSELMPGDHLEMALEGSLIANFFNQVQLERSGADISATSLGNEVKGFSTAVTIRDVAATYIYPNTLATLEIDRRILKLALERCAEYFDLDEQGKPVISDRFLKPKVEHYNYDFYSGVEVVMDLRRPLGDRVVSLKRNGTEIGEDEKLTLCMNNYRSSGTGGYSFFEKCPMIKNQQTEISEMIMDYISEHPNITVDRKKYLTVLY